MLTLQHSIKQLSLPLTSGALDGPAKTLVTPTPSEKDWQENKADFSTPLWGLLHKLSQRGLSWKMCRASFRQTQEPLLNQLSTRSKTLGIWGDGLRATLPMRACLTTETEFSLSQVLETDVPIKSLLTAANCLGILRREEKAGRTLDPTFLKALEETLRLWYNVAAASGIPKHEASAPRYVPKLENIKEAIQTDQYCVARNLTWTECEQLMGFPPGWTVVEGDSSETPLSRQSLNGSDDE